jgi:hypothetical protein
MMKIPSQNNGNTAAKIDYPVLAPSMYPAYLTRVVGIGTQVKKGWKDAPDSKVFKINFGFEICGQSLEDAEGNLVPRMAFKNTVPIYSKSDKGHAFDIARAFIPTAANTQNVDWLGLVGKPCMIQVGQYKANDGTMKNCVDAVMPPMAGMPMPDIIGDLVTFNPYSDTEVSGLYDWEVKVLGEALDGDSIPINGASKVVAAPASDSKDDKPPFDADVPL